MPSGFSGTTPLIVPRLLVIVPWFCPCDALLRVDRVMTLSFWIPCLDEGTELTTLSTISFDALGTRVTAALVTLLADLGATFATAPAILSAWRGAADVAAFTISAAWSLDNVVASAATAALLSGEILETAPTTAGARDGFLETIMRTASNATSSRSALSAFATIDAALAASSGAGTLATAFAMAAIRDAERA